LLALLNKPEMTKENCNSPNGENWWDGRKEGENKKDRTNKTEI